MRTQTALILILLLIAALVCAQGPGRSGYEPLLAYGQSELLHQMGAAPRPNPPPMAIQSQRACFVTFYHGNQVMACFGSFTPRRASLADEISDNIRLALKNDHRAANLTPETARGCDLQISFPGKPERIADWRQVDPLREGLFVERSDGYGVAIVPGEARTASYAYRSAMKRLGLKEGAGGVRLYRFDAELISTRRPAQNKNGPP